MTTAFVFSRRVFFPRLLPAMPVFVLAFVLAAWPGLAEDKGEDAARNRTTVYSRSTVVLYNTAVPESRELATFYAEARGISPSNIVALTCPDREQITREEYNTTIAEPLRDAFVGNEWWKVSLDPERGIEVIANRIHIIVSMYGMPLKISNDILPPKPKIDFDTGKEIPVPSEPFATSACSVDSELCLLAAYKLTTKGPLKNPYHEQDVNFYQMRIGGMMLAGRIDGPNPAIAKRLITDALAAEESGLWGVAYIDQAQKLKQGDDWLQRCVEIFDSEGIPVVLDIHRSRFPSSYPMRNASLYFGWYAVDADGPFLNPRFRFNRGAIACHLHSYSAETVRSTTQKWCGPLLDRGAAAVLGNVYEPYLNFTHHFDIFNDRLLKGYTFIESACMAAPALSWMNVAIGDPLYRPFGTWATYDSATYGKDQNADMKAFRLATKRWGEDNPLLMTEKLASAAAKLESGFIYEGLALRAARQKNYVTAEDFLEDALKVYKDPADQVRIRLHQIDFYRAQGKQDDAIALLELIPKDFPGLPETLAATALLDLLRPPLPPLPPPPGKKPQ